MDAGRERRIKSLKNDHKEKCESSFEWKVNQRFITRSPIGAQTTGFFAAVENNPKITQNFENAWIQDCNSRFRRCWWVEKYRGIRDKAYGDLSNFQAKVPSPFNSFRWVQFGLINSFAPRWKKFQLDGDCLLNFFFLIWTRKMRAFSRVDSLTCSISPRASRQSKPSEEGKKCCDAAETKVFFFEKCHEFKLLSDIEKCYSLLPI